MSTLYSIEEIHLRCVVRTATELKITYADQLQSQLRWMYLQWQKAHNNHKFVGISFLLLSKQQTSKSRIAKQYPTARLFHKIYQRLHLMNNRLLSSRSQCLISKTILHFRCTCHRSTRFRNQTNLSRLFYRFLGRHCYLHKLMNGEK